MGEIADEMLDRYLGGDYDDMEEDEDGLLFSSGPRRFETSCRTCRRTITMVPRDGKWHPFDKHGEEPHRCTLATASDFPAVEE